MERNLYVKLKDCMSNSVDLDETAPYEPSHLDLRCLQKPIAIAYGSDRVKDFERDLIFIFVCSNVNLLTKH